MPVADDRTAQTPVCVDDGFTETLVQEVIEYTGGCLQAETTFCQAETTKLVGGCGDAGCRSETPVFAGGGGDGG